MATAEFHNGGERLAGFAIGALGVVVGDEDLTCVVSQFKVWAFLRAARGLDVQPVADVSRQFQSDSKARSNRTSSRGMCQSFCFTFRDPA